MKRTFLLALIAGVLMIPRAFLFADENSFDRAQYDIAGSHSGHREVIFRFTPNIGGFFKFGQSDDPLIRKLGVTSRPIREFVYFMLNPELDVQLYKPWFLIMSFTYANARYKKPLSGGINMFGPSLGIRYVLMENRYVSDDDLFLDKSRYWVGAQLGPYVTYQRVSEGAISGSRTDVDFAMRAGAGFDYFFNDHIGIGGQLDVQYIAYIDDYIILSGGPSILGRF